MSRATLLPPARSLMLLIATLLVATGAMLSVGTPPADAAKPCWERLIDDWVDNGRLDGVYSAACIEQARRHLPEDIRAYSDIEEKLDAAELQATRSIAQSHSGGTSTKAPEKGVQPSTTTPQAREPKVAARDPGPISNLLGSDTTSADSIPLPLILLTVLAAILLIAGGAGLAARKLQARRARSS